MEYIYRSTAVIEPIRVEGEFAIQVGTKFDKYWRQGSKYYKQQGGTPSWHEIDQDEYDRAWAVFYGCLNSADRIIYKK